MHRAGPRLRAQAGQAVFRDRLHLAPGESADDALAGCFAVGGPPGGSFGRAPVIYDMELAYTVWGYLGDAPPDLVEFRADLFPGAAHDYGRQRLDRRPGPR